MTAHYIALAAMFALLTVCAGQRRPPNYSLDDMPVTSFDCRDKTIGGYYADPEADCQMFHVCVKMGPTDTQDFRFLCPNDTMFDQENQICANWFDIDCEANSLYYGKGFDLLRVGRGPASDDVLQKTAVFPEQRLPAVIVPRPDPQRRDRFNQQRDEQELFRGSSSSDIHRGRDEEDEEYERLNKKKNKGAARRKQNSRGRRPVTTTEAPEDITTYVPENTREQSVPEYTTINRNNNNNRNNERQSTAAPADFSRNTQRNTFSTFQSTNNAFQQSTSPQPNNNNNNNNNNQQRNFQINVPSKTVQPRNDLRRNQERNFQTSTTSNNFQNSVPQNRNNDIQKSQQKNEFQTPTTNNDFQSSSSPQPRNNERNQQRNFPTPAPFEVPRTQPRNRNNNNNFQNNQPRVNNDVQRNQQQRNNVQDINTGFQQNSSPQPNNNNNNNDFQRNNQQRNNFQNQAPRNQQQQQQQQQQRNQNQNQGNQQQQRNQTPNNNVTPTLSPNVNNGRATFPASTLPPVVDRSFQPNYPSSTLTPPLKNEPNQGFLGNSSPQQQSFAASTITPTTYSRQNINNELTNPSTLSPTTYALQQRKNAARRNFQSTQTPGNFNNARSTATPTFQQSVSTTPFPQSSFASDSATPRPQFAPTTYSPQSYKPRQGAAAPQPFQRRVSRPRDDFINNDHPDELLKTAPSSGIRASDLNALQKASSAANYPSSTPFPPPSSPRSFTAPRQQQRQRVQQQSTQEPQRFDNNRLSTQFFNAPSSPQQNFFNPSTAQPFNSSPAKSNFNNPSTTNFNSKPTQNFNNPSTAQPNFSSIPAKSPQGFTNSQRQNTFFNPSTAQPSTQFFNSPSSSSVASSTFRPVSSQQPQRQSPQNFSPSSPQPFQQQKVSTQNPDKKPNKPNKKANSDYDYAYYDETPYDEYDGLEHISEFTKTKN